jgi:hypothetical protein
MRRLRERALPRSPQRYVGVPASITRNARSPYRNCVSHRRFKGAETQERKEVLLDLGV